MTINLETAEKAVKWGSAGFSFLLAVISIVNMTIQARNGKTEEEKSE